MPGPLGLDDARELLSDLGSDPEQRLSTVLEARGALGPKGPIPPALQNLSPAQMAILDRLASGQRDRARFGLPVALASTAGYAGYEGLKGLAERVRPAKAALGALGSAFGNPEETLVDERTSPASLANVEAYLSGVLR